MRAGLAARGRELYGLGGWSSDNLVTINTATGAAAPVGSLVTMTVSEGGLAFDAYGTLWGINDDEGTGKLFQVNTDAGTAIFIANISGTDGIESLAIPMPRFHTSLPVVMREF